MNVLDKRDSHVRWGEQRAGVGRRAKGCLLLRKKALQTCLVVKLLTLGRPHSNESERKEDALRIAKQNCLCLPRGKVMGNPQVAKSLPLLLEHLGRNAYGLLCFKFLLHLSLLG